MITFRIQATVDDARQVIGVRAGARVGTPERAQQIAAAFPKFIRVKGGPCSGFAPADFAAAHGVPLDASGRALRAYGSITAAFSFSADRNNGGKNEAGLKRLRAFLRCASWEYDADAFGNSATREEFFAFCFGNPAILSKGQQS